MNSLAPNGQTQSKGARGEEFFSLKKQSVVNVLCSCWHTKCTPVLTTYTSSDRHAIKILAVCAANGWKSYMRLQLGPVLLWVDRCKWRPYKPWARYKHCQDKRDISRFILPCKSFLKNTKLKICRNLHKLLNAPIYPPWDPVFFSFFKVYSFLIWNTTLVPKATFEGYQGLESWICLIRGLTNLNFSKSE